MMLPRIASGTGRNQQQDAAVSRRVARHGGRLTLGRGPAEESGCRFVGAMGLPVVAALLENVFEGFIV